MDWNTVKRKNKLYWSKRWIRIIISILILTVTTFIQYYLSRIPQSIDVGSNDSKYVPAKSKAKQEEIVIHNPKLNKKDEPLLSFDGKKAQTVEFHSSRAQLSEDTRSFLMELLQGTSDGPSSDFEQVDYFVKESDQQNATAGVNDDTCRMFIRVYVINNMPSEVHFYKPENGSQHSQFLEIRAKDADLVVHLKQKTPDSKRAGGNPYAPGCKKTLQVKDWSISNYGEYDLRIIVPADSTFRFDFYTTNDQTSLETNGSLFEPFRLGDQFLQAKGVSVITATGGKSVKSNSSPPIFEVDVAKDKELLTINNLRVGIEELQMSFSGVGVIKSNGEPVTTLSLLDVINKYPFVAGLFGLANTTLLGWLIHAIFRKNPKRPIGF